MISVAKLGAGVAVWVVFSAAAMSQSGKPAIGAPCQSSQLSASIDNKESDQIDGGVGNHAITIAISNISPSRCTVNGVPGLTLLDTAKRRLQIPVCQNCQGYLFHTQPPGEVLLDPGAAAYVVIGYNINDGAGPCSQPATLSLRPPGDSRPLRASFAGFSRICGKVNITPFLAKPPVDGFLPDPGESKK